MSEPYFIPPQGVIEMAAIKVPQYMRPNLIPSAVVLEGALSDAQCDRIIQKFLAEDPYDFPHCDSETRECPRPLDTVLTPVVDYALSMNERYWKFYLDEEPAAWMQTYKGDGSYDPHTDAEPGQSRKLSTIALLSNPEDYSGGDLRFTLYPDGYLIPKTRGTMVAFPSWILHDVSTIESGVRQTINLGYWGPPFR